MLRRESTNSLAWSNGSIVAGLAECKTAGTYTQIRVWCSNVGSAVTGFKMGVWSADGVTLRAETPNTSLTGKANTWVTATLSTPVTLAAGESVYLGAGATFTTTSPNIRAIIGPGFGNFWPSTTSEGAMYYRFGTGWTGGTATLPGSLGVNGGPAAVPLVELVP